MAFNFVSDMILIVQKKALATQKLNLGNFCIGHYHPLKSKSAKI
jgi:hypothetical protein